MAMRSPLENPPPPRGQHALALDHALRWFDARARDVVRSHERVLGSDRLSVGLRSVGELEPQRPELAHVLRERPAVWA